MKFNFGDRVTILKTNPGATGKIGGIYADVESFLAIWDKPDTESYRERLLESWLKYYDGTEEDLLKENAYMVVFDGLVQNVNKEEINRIKKELLETGENVWNAMPEEDKAEYDKEEWLQEGLNYNLAVRLQRGLVRATGTFEGDLKLTEDIFEEIGKFQNE